MQDPEGVFERTKEVEIRSHFENKEDYFEYTIIKHTFIDKEPYVMIEVNERLNGVKACFSVNNLGKFIKNMLQVAKDTAVVAEEL